MLLFSTVLFVDGNPVGYKVFQEEKNRLVLNPAENPNRTIVPPVIAVRGHDGIWDVEGTNDRDLIDQVLEDVTLNYTDPFFPSSGLSAAP